MRGDIFRLRANPAARGHEQAGARYCVILQSDDLPLSTCIVAPTSRSAYGYVFRPTVTVRGEATRLMLDQLRAVDVERALGEPVGRVTPDELADIDALLPAVLGMGVGRG